MIDSFKKFICVGLFLFLFSPMLFAQEEPDRIIFTDPREAEADEVRDGESSQRFNALGFDLIVSEDGFGLGFFFRHRFSTTLSLVASTSVSEKKDSREFEIYDYYGQAIPLNKVNRFFRIPLFFGLHYRLFEDDIVENFRPFIGGGVGPVLIYTTPYEKEFFESLGYGHPHYTYGGYLTLGSYFGFDPRTLFGIQFRYYIIPMPAGIPSVYYQGKIVDMPNAHTFMISLSIGTAY